MNTTTNLQSKFKSWEQAVQWLREQPDQADLVLSAYYDDPLLVAAERYWNSPEWHQVRTFFPKTRGQALDVGAGRGIASYALAKDGYEVSALEPDPNALVGAQAIRDLAKQSNLPIKTVEEFSETLPFEDNSFDLLFARAVLHHTQDLDQACKEFYRVLKPGGIFIAAREHVISRQEDLKVFLEIHPLHKIYGGENAFLLSQYTSAIENAKFQINSTLSPFQSVINFAPYTTQTLKAELAKRASKNIPSLEKLVLGLLSNELCWQILRPLLDAADHRPGRLYTFIAEKLLEDSR